MALFPNDDSFTNETIEFVKEIINTIILCTNCDYTVDNFPGKDNGMPFEWWKDNDYILENLKPFGQTPNAIEVLLFALHPAQAIIHIKNSYLSRDKAIELVVNGTFTNLHNGKADAFRHAFWNARDTADFGSVVTELFTDAHEWNSSNHALETEMDFFNNGQGITIGSDFNIFSTDTSISNMIFTYIYSGALLYLNPLDSSGNIIEQSTQLLPTNL